MRSLQLKLYVTGKSHRVELAVRNLRLALDRQLDGDYDLVVSDILQNPELAEQQKILATPTLVKEMPLPVKRIIGDFSDTDKVLYALDLQTHSPVQGGRQDDE